jgi:hypothetical protein
MEMKKAIFLGAVLASAGMLGTANAAWAQSDTQSGTQAKQNKPKPHKVWTDDNIGGSSGGVTVAAASNPSANAQPAATSPDAAAAPDQAAAKTDAGTAQAKVVGAAPVLSNPKSTEEADKMIAWENRDIDAQQEGLDKLRAQIADAPQEQRDRLEKLYDQRAKVLIDTKNELKNLQEKKKTLENPSQASASAQPPQQ